MEKAVGRTVSRIVVAGAEGEGAGVGFNCRRIKTCFPASTPVATEAGLRPIEAILPGNRVWAYDLINGIWQLRRVVETYEGEYESDLVAVTVAGETIEATSRHPFWVVEGEGLGARPRPDHIPETPLNAPVPGRWVDAGELRVGDVLLLKSGDQAAVTRLTVRRASLRVYNLHVEGLYCYAVGARQILVHNNCGNPTQGALDQLPGKIGKTGPIKEVPDETTLKNLFDTLSKDGKTVKSGTYPGVVKELPDGTIIRMRPKSKSGGSALDVTLPDGTIYKVHVK
jgi:hypothetical protein